MIAVQKAVMADYGKKIDSEVVEIFIRKGDTDAPDNYKNIFLEEAEKYCRKIFDALYRCEYDPDFMKLYVCGGGVQLIRRFGNYPSDRVIFIDDILDARTLYSGNSLADLYDESTMPPELRKAHQSNDKAVMKAYGFKSNMT